ncbi:MAG: hypothetical protein VX519_08490 [Myxococcota bacterium]|nr:hypothetical protein [Myxococcota bacterium]
MCLGLGCGAVEDSGVLETGREETGQSDTGSTGLTGLQGRAVQALVGDGSFEGHEEVYFVSESGMGADVCRFRYALSSQGVRQDCDSCDWAFDLTVSGVELLFEEEPGCLETLGTDSSGLGSLEGQVVSYGYTEEYFGHAQVVLMEVGTAWAAVANAAWDPATGAFSFDWREGYVEY